MSALEDFGLLLVTSVLVLNVLAIISCLGRRINAQKQPELLSADEHGLASFTRTYYEQSREDLLGPGLRRFRRRTKRTEDKEYFGDEDNKLD